MIGKKEYTLETLASLTKSKLVGDSKHLINGVEVLDAATSSDASFLANPRYREAMKKSLAGVICIDANTPPIEGRNFLISEEPSLCFQKIVELVLPHSEEGTHFKGIHPTAVIHPTATIGKDVTIGPYTVIDAYATIGNGCVIYPHCFVGSYTHIGNNCLLYSNVTVRELCEIGNRVILQPGVVIGSCGFGYVTDKMGKHSKLPQVGNVVLEDDVEIGANTTIDRARFKTTRIGQGTKIDNLVQIGHNVQVGLDNMVVSQTGIAGSTKTGRNVIIGGQVGIVGHIEIADGTMIAAKSGVSKNIAKGGRYAGVPVMGIADYNRQQVLLRNIEEFVKHIEELKKRIEELEKDKS